MIVGLVGTFGIFLWRNCYQVPDLSLQEPIAVISFMIIGFPINHGHNFFQLFGWESFLCDLLKKSKEVFAGILQTLFSIKTFFVASWGNFAELNNLQILFCDFLFLYQNIRLLEVSFIGLRPMWKRCGKEV